MTVTSPKSPYYQKSNNINKIKNGNRKKNIGSEYVNDKINYSLMTNDMGTKDGEKEEVKNLRNYQYFHVLAVIQIQRTYRGFLVRCREWNFNSGDSNISVVFFLILDFEFFFVYVLSLI